MLTLEGWTPVMNALAVVLPVAKAKRFKLVIQAIGPVSLRYRLVCTPRWIA